MKVRLKERGEGNFGCVVWTLLFAVVALVAWKAIPVKIASSQLYDFMVEQAQFAAGNTPGFINKQILAKAKDLDLPVDPKNVTVEKVNNDRIRMKCTFTVPLEFPGYTYNWNFDYEVDRPIYIF